ncbi:MAG: hypothetical protein KAZ71_07725 [Bacteroidia bacterium]|nr:hypothetical protein [Bacteroidia bacterium]
MSPHTIFIVNAVTKIANDGFAIERNRSVLKGFPIETNGATIIPDIREQKIADPDTSFRPARSFFK